MPSTFTKFLYHLVWSTKRREPLIRPKFQARLDAYIGGIIRQEHGIALAIGGMADHIHVVAWLRPEPAVPKIMQAVKAGSSQWVNQLPEYPGRFTWQEGYAGFSVSVSQLNAAIRYVEHQEEHHRGVGYQEELRALLIKHEFEFDEDPLWT